MKEWKPWEESSKWKSKPEFFTWLRGQIRKSIWSNYPPRNEFKQSKLRKATQEDYDNGLSPRTKKVGRCEFCKNWFPASKLQVDHKDAAGSLRNEDDIAPFITRMACMKSQMRLACHDCHTVQTYSERMGISFEQAKIEKAIIAKMNLPKAQQDATIALYDLPCGNDVKRKESWRIILKKEMENGDN